MKKPTPSAIKYSDVLGEHFFSRSSMQFFGQTMSDFSTDWYDKGRGIVRLSAPMYDLSRGRKYMGTTERFIDVSGADWVEIPKWQIEEERKTA